MSLPRFPHRGNYIISKRENIAYLTGLNQIHPVNREALLFVSPHKTILYHSIFLTTPSGIPSLPMSPNHPLAKVLSAVFPPSSQITFEAHNLTYAEYQKISAALPHSTLIPSTDIIETLRLTKDQSELKAIKKACAITAKTMSWIINQLPNPGLGNILNPELLLSEFNLARLIEQHLYELGADGLAFPVIVAYDQNSALPHHLPGKTKLTPNSIVLMDFGCMVHGYASDMTRTICLGTPPPRFSEIETAVQAAYTAGLSLLRHHFSVTELTGDESRINKNPGSRLRLRRDPGSKRLTAAQLDLTVRSVIETAGYGKEFIHTSGHGLGLEIHEQPSLNTSNQMDLKPNMVITLEPGIYITDHFGYHHENTLSIYS